MLGGGCMKQKHLHSTIGPAHAPNQHTQYVTLPFSYIELIVSVLYMSSRELGCARLYHTDDILYRALLKIYKNGNLFNF